MDLQKKRAIKIQPCDGFFWQRGSYLKQHPELIVRQVIFKPPREDQKSVARKLKSQREFRRQKNKEARYCAGSFFVNVVKPHKPRFPLVRSLIKEAGLASLDINGAHYTPNYQFLSAKAHTRDRDVAELVGITAQTLKRKFGIVPKKEVDIVGKYGNMSLEELIKLA